jgi:hypothetical protein
MWPKTALRKREYKRPPHFDEANNCYSLKATNKLRIFNIFKEKNEWYKNKLMFVKELGALSTLKGQCHEMVVELSEPMDQLFRP